MTRTERGQNGEESDDERARGHESGVHEGAIGPGGRT